MYVLPPEMLTPQRPPKVEIEGVGHYAPLHHHQLIIARPGVGGLGGGRAGEAGQANVPLKLLTPRYPDPPAMYILGKGDGG